MKVAVAQMRSGRKVAANIAAMETLVRQAARAGAQYIQTPEMTNIVERDRDALLAAIQPEESDPTLARARALARELGVHIHLGSLAVRGTGADHAANRGFLIAPSGAVAARYDKIHMFDVDLPGGESWRESRTYEPGGAAVVAPLGPATLGLSVCYDLRFPHLYRALAQAGADVLAVPSAFTRQTGEAHWHVLQRARAIENGAFVIAAAQGGRHEDGRDTFGHSLVVNPWGRVIAEAGEEPAAVVVEIDLAESAAARGRIPALRHDRSFDLPEVEAAARKVVGR